MNYTSTILVEMKTHGIKDSCAKKSKTSSEPKDLLEIFEPELKATINNRAFYTIEEGKGTLKFIIKAKDSVSLRSTLNSITKLLTVYEKLK